MRGCSRPRETVSRRSATSWRSRCAAPGSATAASCTAGARSSASTAAAVDHLRAPAQGLAAAAVAAAPLHGAVLPRRGGALAAGHRPCALCRRAGLQRVPGGVDGGTGEATPLAWQLDRHLHGERLYPRHPPAPAPRAAVGGDPGGAFVLADDGPALVRGRRGRAVDAGGLRRATDAAAQRADPDDHAAGHRTRAPQRVPAAGRQRPDGPLVGWGDPRRSGRVAEGARLLSGYGGSTSIAGSNPAFSASLLKIAHRGYAAQGAREFARHDRRGARPRLRHGRGRRPAAAGRRAGPAPRRSQPARCAAARRRAAADRGVDGGVEPRRQAERDRPGDRRGGAQHRHARAHHLHRRRLGGAGADPLVRARHPDRPDDAPPRIDAAADHPQGRHPVRPAPDRDADPRASCSATAPIW